jgi:CRP/FNR family transcriptional regulator, cyclic AMP receptor protein
MNDTGLSNSYGFEKPLEVRKGQVLFAKGESSAYLYIVEEGEVGIFLDENEKLTLLNTIGEKDFIGEISMFSDDKRNATAIALEDTYLIVVKKVEIQKVLKSCPEWVTNIMLTLSDRLRNTTEVLREHRVVDDMRSAATRSLSPEEINKLQDAVKEYRDRKKL